MMIIPAEFKPSSFKGVGGEWGDEQTDEQEVKHSWTDPYTKISNLSLALLERDKRVKWIYFITD